MAAAQTGVAVIYGMVGTDGLTTTVSGFATFIKDSFDVTNDIKMDEVRDEDNDLVGMVSSGEKFEATIMFTPKSTTKALVAAGLTMPVMGATVTLGNFPDSVSAPIINGAWLYAGGWKLAMKKDGIATYEFKCTRGTFAAAIHTAIS